MTTKPWSKLGKGPKPKIHIVTVPDKAVVAEYGRRKRWAAVDKVHTSVDVRVPCSMSPSNRHSVTLTYSGDGVLLGLTSDCDRVRTGAAYAAGRMSTDTCGYPLRLAREYLHARVGRIERDYHGVWELSSDRQHNRDQQLYVKQRALCRLFGNSLELLLTARDRAYERASRNLACQPEVWTRDTHASELWTKRVLAALDSTTPSYGHANPMVWYQLRIRTHNGVPTQAFIGAECVAIRGARTGWMLHQSRMSTVLKSFGTRGRFCYLCPKNLASRTKGEFDDVPRDFAGDSALEKHVYGVNHFKNFEDTLMAALSVVIGAEC